MLAVVTSHNAHLYEKELDQMFELRYRVLIEDLNWSNLDASNRRERDAFDNDSAIYLLGFHSNWDRVVGCVRLTPTLAPTLTSEIFGYLCEFSGVPRSKDIYDNSRLVVDPECSILGTPNPITSELLLGCYETSLALDLAGLTGVMDTNTLARLLAHGPFVKPLGLPHEVDGDSIVAVQAKITPEVVQRFRESWQITQPVLSKTASGLLLATHRHFHQQFDAEIAA